MGKLDLFEIRLNNPTGVVYAGQWLQGNVVAVLNDGMKIRNARITFKGDAEVRWTEHRGTGKNRHTVTRRGDQTFFHEKVVVWGNELGSDNDSPILPAGEHNWPFQFQVPAFCPTSFEGAHGHIRYSVKCTLDRPWKFDHDTKVYFTVLGVVDLNTNPLAATPIEHPAAKSLWCCCCPSGTLSATVVMSRGGFVPGETMEVSVNVNNESGRSVDHVRVSLEQRTVFRAYGGHTRSTDTTVTEGTSVDLIDSHSTKLVNFSLLIPSVPCTLEAQCQVIDITYNLHVELDPSGMSTDLDIYLPVVIGTIPLRQFWNAPPQPSAPPAPVQNGMDDRPPDYGTGDIPELPPPSYEESVFGQQEITEEGDSEYVRGNKSFAPRYPVYNPTLSS